MSNAFKQLLEIDDEHQLIRDSKATADVAKHISEGRHKPSLRECVLSEALKCVCGDREQDYGSPENNFARISKFWNAYLGVDSITPKDVAAMLGLLKIARIASGNAKTDNWIDLAGYAACGGELEGE